MILPITLYGNPVLRKKCKEIKDSYPNLKTLISDMFETMYQADGVGLAAPQLGLNIRVFVMDTSAFADEENDDKEAFQELSNFKRVFINPKIVKTYGDPWKFKEGCLSIPEIRENVDRPEYVHIEYYDEHWKKHEESLKGLPARVIQHEYDHLDGKLFIDYLSPLKRQLINKKLKKISEGVLKPNYKVELSKKTH